VRTASVDVPRAECDRFLRRLKGRAADAANAVLSAVGHNFRRILAWLRALLRFFLIAIPRLFIIRSALNPTY
jgi:transposase, IS5 family